MACHLEIVAARVIENATMECTCPNGCSSLNMDETCDVAGDLTPFGSLKGRFGLGKSGGEVENE